MKAHYLLGAAILLYSCTPSSSTSNDTTTADGPALVSFSLWNELGVYDSAGEKAKYLSTVYLGEQFTLTGDSVMDGEHLWNKITMSDGKSGWVRADFIAKKKLPAATLEEARIYKRPDLATITDHTFYPMQFVAADPAVNGWIHVKGKRAEDKWFTEGYVQESALTFTAIDAEFAALYKRMMETEKQSVHDAIVTQLESGADFKQSVFFDMVFSADDVEGDGDYVEEAPTGYSIEDVPDLNGDGEGKIINIYGTPDYYFVYKGRAYKLQETSAETILETQLFYHCTKEYLDSLPLDEKVIDVIPGSDYVPA